MPRARGRKSKKITISIGGPSKKRTRIEAESRDAIIKLHEEGMEQKRIATVFNRSPSSISKLLKRQTSKSTSKSLPVGRPKILSARDVRSLKRMVTAAPCASCDSYRKQISEATGKKISRRAISDYLVREDIHCYRVLKKPFMTNVHKKKRLAWAKEHCSWNLEDWTRCIFSDETMFTLRGQTHKRFVHKRSGNRFDQRYTKQTKKFGKQIMFWGSFCYCGVGPLIAVHGTMNQHQYLDILNKTLVDMRKEFLPAQDVIFQQDNASCHKTITVMKWIKDNDFQTFNWPPNSPDLNPIENLWATLKRRTYSQGPFSTVDQLEKVIRQKWSEITLEEIHNLIESMPNRCFAVIKSGGGPPNIKRFFFQE